MTSIIKNINKKFLILFIIAIAFFAPVAANAVEVSTDVGFEAAIADSSSKDITLTGNITLTKVNSIDHELTIDGNGYTITSTANARHFTLTGSSNITFTNLTLAGGSSGGGIDINGSATVIFNSVTFSNNKSANNGGAVSISNASATVTFDGASFTGNGTTSTNLGGAVYISNANSVTFSGTTRFDGNTATSGGAIHSAIIPTFSGTVTFGSNTKNTASNSGGAVYIASSTGTLALSSIFTFSNNEATGTSGNGGAVYSNGAITVSGASFRSNKAGGNGGAVYSSGAVTISSGTFDTNEASSNGGAVYSGGNVTIRGGTFTSNTAQSGGAIYATGTAAVTGGTFGEATTGNTARGNNASSQGGGAIYANIITITGSSASPIEISNQTALGAGGALYAETSLTASQAIFENNKAASGGAVRVASSGTTLSLRNVSFVGNETTNSDGGAIFSGATNTNEISHCFFSKNVSQIDGGAIALGNDNANFTLEYSYFVDNTAGKAGSAHQYGGGAIYLTPVGVAVINSCTFSGNRVNHTDNSLGGAVYLANTSSSRIENCTFYNNSAEGANENDGGAVYLTGTGSVIISFCTFSENRATTGNTLRGGALFVNNGSLNIIGSIVAGNDTGGDIYHANGNIVSGGYNRVGRLAAGSGSASGYTNWDSNNVGTGAATDIADNGTRNWTSASFFGSETLKDNGGERAGAGSDANYSAIVPTIALSEANPNSTRAVDGARNISTNTVIPNGSYPQYDERRLETVQRAQMGAAPDIGAFEVYQSSGGDGTNNPYAEFSIRSIQMSGIPNTLSIVGQTAILHATVTYLNGTTTTTTEPLTWRSSNTNVAVFENANSGSIYTKAIGTATITVTARNQYSDSKTIYVIWDLQETNVHPNVQNVIEQLNLQLNQDNINFYLMATTDLASAANDSTFKSAFRNEWGVEPKIIACDESDFSNNSSFRRAAKNGYNKAFTAGINTVVNNQQTGALLPVMCVWTFDKDELASSFNTTKANLNAMSDSAFSKWLFEKINIGFYRTGGKFLPAISGSNESTLQSSEFSFNNFNNAESNEDADYNYNADDELDFVTAEDASNSGALSVQRGGDSVAVSMLAYIANVQPNGDSGSKLISTSDNKKFLVMPGGSTPFNNLANISGTIWAATAESSNSGSNNTTKSSGGGGGGGCNAFNGGIFILLITAFLLFNKKHA